MAQLLVLLLSLWAACAGDIFPLPTSVSRGTTTLSINPQSFAITAAPGSSTPLLQNAISRYQSLFFPFPASGSLQSGASVTILNITVNVPEQNPDLQLGVDESYSISVTTNGAATITANRVWGAMHGLETFSQLIDFNLTSRTYSIPNAAVTITDSPRFPWRGLMIDTSRHFLSPSTIYRAIDALSYNKMNTLHWHTVDAESFPIQSLTYPLLNGKGAYDPTLAVYTQQTIQNIVNYGYQRGVRVVAEVDIPGHAYSWGMGYPTVRAQCPSSLASNINNYPLDPSQTLTFQIVDSLLGELTKLFTDNTFHVGGDEVVYNCWLQNPSIAAWMQTLGLKTGTDVYNYFESQLYPMMTKYNKTMVMWEDVYNDGVSIPSGTIIEVWSDATTMGSITAAGYRGILAYGYYLDKQQPIPGLTHYEFEDTWLDMYGNEPTTGVASKNAHLVIGGEAVMFGEQVDDTCFDERVWPRASAVAERMWSAQDVLDTTNAKTRLIAFRCRVSRRGINGGPIAPDYCPTTLN